MNDYNIIPPRVKLPNIKGNSYKKKVILTLLILLVVGSALTYVSKFALANNQPTVDTLSQLNTKIDSIEHQLMVNSQSWNVLEHNRLEIIAKQEYLETGNNSLREQEQKLIDEKKGLIVWK